MCEFDQYSRLPFNNRLSVFNDDLVVVDQRARLWNEFLRQGCQALKESGESSANFIESTWIFSKSFGMSAFQAIKKLIIVGAGRLIKFMISARADKKSAMVGENEPAT